MYVHFTYALAVFVCWVFFLDFSFEIRSHFVSQVGLEFVIPLPQPLQCCGCSGEPPSQFCMLFSMLCRRSAHSVFTTALESSELFTFVLPICVFKQNPEKQSSVDVACLSSAL